MLNSEEISADYIKSGFGGYKKKATREYLDHLREEYDSLCKENIELKDKLSVLSEGVQYYKNMEKSLQKALVLAERTTSETIHAAEVKAQAMENEAKTKADVLTKEAQMKAATYEKEVALKADAMIRDAKRQADTAIAQGNEELRRIHSQIMTLIQQYEQYKSQYKQLALAQMNVLESEAYTLEAPILKTIQGKLSEKEGQDKKSEQNDKEQIEDNIVNPIPSGPSSTVEKNNQSTENGEQEKKMYMDGRGQVYEVHDFREVSISGSKKDAFDDLDSESNSDTDEKQPEKQPDDYFKLFDAPDSKQIPEEESKVSTTDMTDEKLEHMNQTEDPYAEMKRIEKMQLERLRREEEQHAELLKNQTMSKEVSIQNFEEEPVIEQPAKTNFYQEEPVIEQSAKTNFYQEEPVMEQSVQTTSDAKVSMEDLLIKGQSDNENNDFIDMLHKDDDKPIDLSDLKHMEAENQNEVSLGEVSEEENKYFSEFPKEMKAISFEERNSLSYEMDHEGQFESKGSEREGFKSFRDFESEL